MRTKIIISLFAVTLILSGCNRNPFDVVPVTGSVKVDGKPMQGIKVIFHPTDEGNPGFAETDAEGKFKLSFPSAEAGTGVPVGTYQPTFSKMETEEREPTASPEEELLKYGNKPPKTFYRIPKKYGSIKTCGIDPVTVEKGRENTFDFELSMTP